MMYNVIYNCSNCTIICVYVCYEIGYFLYFQKHKNRKPKTKMARSRKDQWREDGEAITQKVAGP